ncbi:hypothetical protein BGZ98_008395 [Dissophora globulifera]|nr:hypothetical protein BGZ98_008395 [Dissophora globulifera]
MDTDLDNAATLAEIASLDQELGAIEDQITDLESRRVELVALRDSLLSSLAFHDASTFKERTTVKDKDYGHEDFAWSADLKRLARDHWHIMAWRDKQLHAMNASLDGRDTFVLMPTGGGKSLCYQLPALITPGITLVVSPLLSLIRDQAFHLEEASIGVGMLTSYTTKEESKRIMDAMLGPIAPKAGASKRPDKSAPSLSTAAGAGTPHEAKDTVKLVYVTPEKISKSKRFMNHLEKVYAAGRLSRIVVDECHCCSNLGHDFRPDYKKLGILRVLFPNTPIIALTATASQSVIQSVLSTLNLKPIDQPGGTLLFDSPLFRPNLAYRVLTRPNSNSGTFKFLVNYIRDRHHKSNGIIYCLSKKDTHVFADGIREASSGRIGTAAYHADIEDYEKDQIHEQWRDGRIQVVCATIAFGLGINHPNVRFVIHVCMAKSLEVYGMIKYAQDVRTCRHQLLDMHFSKNIAERLAPCGFCDNCTLAGSDVVKEDLKTDVRALCLLVDRLKTVNERVTLNKLVEAWRGVGSLRAIAKVVRDEFLTAVVPKRDNKDDYDRIISHLIVHGYLREDFHFTAYSTLAYIVNGARSNPFLSGRPTSTLPSIMIEFGRDPSRIADENDVNQPIGSSRSQHGPDNAQKTNETDRVSGTDVHLILDEVDSSDDTDHASPLMMRHKRKHNSGDNRMATHGQMSETASANKNRKMVITVLDDDDDDYGDPDDLDDEDFM